MMTGFYIVIAHDNLVKKIVGLNIFQVSVFLFYITMAKVRGGTAPILADGISIYSNPFITISIFFYITISIKKFTRRIIRYSSENCDIMVSF